MSVAIDSGPTAGTAGAGTPHNVTFNNAAGTFMVNMRGFGGGASDTMNSSSYNSVSMTNGTSDIQVGQQARIDYLATPATGSNTMASTYSSAGAEENEVALSFTGQDSVTPFVAQTVVKGTSTGGTMSFVLAAGEIGIAMISYEGFSLTGSLTSGTSLSHTFIDTFNGTNFWAAKVTATGDAAWTWSGSHPFVIVGAIIKPAPTGAQNMLAWIKA